MGKGLVSVIVTTYYRNEILEECLRSVRAQTYEPVEIIVVDGSGEGYASSVVEDDDRITYVDMDEDNGPHAARSLGVSYASGEYIQFLDDDDRLVPEKIRRQVDLLCEDDDVGIVYCGYETDSGDVSLPHDRFSGDILAEALSLNTYSCQTSTMLARSSLIEDIAPFQHWWIRDDVTLMIELARRTQFDYVAEPLVIRRDDEGDSLSTRLGEFSPVENAYEIIDYYRELYDDNPASRNRCLARSYKAEARLLVSQNLYSVEAIALFIRSMKLSESMTLRDVVELLTMSAGRPGWVLGSRFYERFHRSA